ncbi:MULTISPECIES: DUF3072 domain-containing protein [Janibacter]|uniref:DUF3072 domain-containing protein n=1 Tax=Janibacter melonis TaxID=262209 RepID=A0A176QE68_9MICO|nr:DUF3072 domain-containing protein [Janibacter melonis]MBD5829774.1 DUF3072 domain-containing protein [Janibacter melonis]MCB5992989.1 DUF3072 domain-containing protein [Janibacter melonis]MCM3555246.1 DUF3072 domain-containing protein [Janibacter melonis]OAB87972.1 hypothetical protein AWH69_08145 [Janibacter melonis]QFQ29868.1 DUF3072 domain-containing protein [Janibacter melonis]
MSEPTQHDQQTGAPVPTDDSTTSTAGAGGETIGATPDATTGSDGSLERDPEQWVTGDEPMTAAQRSYLDTLAKEAGEELPADLTKAQASEHIDRLQQGSKRVG